MSYTRLCAFLLLIPVGAFVLTGCGQPASTNPPQGPDSASNTNPAEQAVTLTADQLSAVKIAPVGTYRFPVEINGCGNISYDKVTDPSTSTKSVAADVPESDSPLVRMEQPVEVEVMAYPGRDFDGKVVMLGGSVWDSGGNPAVDPNNHRVMVRCEVADPKNELYPGMLASVTIQVQAPVESIAIPMKGVVRNGDGTMAAWVTTDRQRFVQRFVKVGLQKDGQYQVLNGLKPGELVVTDGAVFLSNILFAPPSD